MAFTGSRFRRALTLYSLAGLVAALALTWAATAAAHAFTQKDLLIDHPWARETPKGAQVGAGYLTVENKGKTPDRLLAVLCNASERVELHTMRMENGVMIMRPMDQGFEVAPGQKLVLQPGGNHVMFLGLKAPFAAGQSIPAKLRFEKAGEIAVDFKVEPLAAPAPGQSGHGH